MCFNLNVKFESFKMQIKTKGRIQMRNKKSIVIVSTSMSEASRSRLALSYCEQVILDCASENIGYDFLDVRDIHTSYTSKKAKAYIKKFQKADAIIMGIPIHNWGASAQAIDFLSNAIDSEQIKAFRPCILIGGAGSDRALLALDGIVRSFLTETNAMILGKPIIVSANETNQEKTEMNDNVVERLEKVLEKMLELLDA